MDEFELIRRISPSYYRQSSVIKGIGDDAFVFRATGDVVFTTDTMVEDVHFSRQTMEPEAIGYRALAANISDLAAMGSDPAFYSVSLVVSPEWTNEEILALYEGMERLGKQHGMDLIGGDTVGGKQLVVSITAHGYIHKGKGRYRSHARPGDLVFVTGTLGDARGGLEQLMQQRSSASPLIARHRYPEPRAHFASGLEPLQRVCLNDVSDGIASEANEIAAVSGVRVTIREQDLPISEVLLQNYPDQAVEWALSGGEDFELLGTIAQEDREALLAIAEHRETPVTFIGTVSSADAPEVILQSGKESKRLLRTGYTHLQERR
ncbi:thiamine-phosphate kinase [Salimicrobium halophilum]|uniref:Thiamine-monophosphate kinase n=1 Tax=Salimicrobium halophilum TaxID=86666 RepID=A0A1G8WKV5_9BACI|nr:thiamine-phosphate kinase [Salimicrobium halophilum]SDJ78230.1 thiamine-phosphate kinase [Salimicrobium halophilum]